MYIVLLGDLVILLFCHSIYNLNSVILEKELTYVTNRNYASIISVLRE